ncbi:hypothetical protein B0J14DRAFT_116817 [Halenospora varia]|nr:hypothetical protein B0J14DRAFT_116817 [Halenospora varia]
MYWHSKQARKHLARLDALPWWIFLDIMYAFNDWLLVIKLMQQEMAVLDKRFTRDRPKVDILTFTQVRHSFRTTLIALRETHSSLFDSLLEVGRLCGPLASISVGSIRAEAEELQRSLPEYSGRNLREPEYKVPLVNLGNYSRSRRNWSRRIFTAELYLLPETSLQPSQCYCLSQLST